MTLINNLIEFIIYIMPGFIAREIYISKYPVRERNEFSQIAWSIIIGIIISNIVRWLDIHLLNSFLNSNSLGFPALKFIIALIIAGFIFGGIWIFLNYLRFKISKLNSKLKFLAPDPQSIWVQINQSSLNEWAVVFSKDGSIYIGWISNYTYNPHLEDQDFLLADAKRVDENLKEMYCVDGIGVYFHTKDVIRIEFVKGQKS